MGRLIDAVTLKPLLRKQYDHYKYRSDDFAIGVCTGLVNAMEELDAAPAVDAAPVVHGRWQGVSPFVDSEECSECRYCIQDEELETPYCPMCGAKMDGE